MMTRKRSAQFRLSGVFSLGLLLAGAASAQYRDDDPRQYRGGEIHQTVARISYLAGPVSFARGDEPDNWQPPDVNVPLTLGDRLFTGRGGRAELQIPGGALVRLDADTDLAALNLTDETKQLSLNSGAAAFEIRRLGADEVFEVDSPNASVTLERAGDYRIDVDRDGNTRVGVRRGRAIVAAGGGQVALSAGDEMDIDGIDSPRYDLVALGRPDPFDNWVAGRKSRSEQRSRVYVSDEIVGVADLDEYGRWEDIPEYGHVWSPASVEAGWTPYRVGHWVWQDPWGWTWVSSEPWGWAPYHYGRWVTRSSRWYWVPVGPRAASVHYAPALVAFVGGGPGSAPTGGGFVGWFPLAPSDPLVSWWGPRTAARAANGTYVNRAHVTAVNQNTFVSGGLVARNLVTDRAVLRDVASAPVLRGPLPVVPTNASLRGAGRGLAAPPRPPAAILERPVVARIAPPPPPPAFSAKVSVIRENRGAPIGADAAARIVQQRAPAPVVAVRPVVSEPGRVTLAPAGAKGGGQGSQKVAQPVPVEAPRGRVLATSERPLAASPGAPPAPGREAAAPRPPEAQKPSPPSAREVQRANEAPQRPAPPPAQARERPVAPRPPDAQEPGPPPTQKATPPPAREVQRERQVQRESQAPQRPAPPPAQEGPKPAPERPAAPAPAPPQNAGRERAAPEPPRADQKSPPKKEEKAKPASEKKKDDKEQKKDEKKPE
jgi:uncharacterized protein DUF6600/FecR-like protein